MTTTLIPTLIPSPIPSPIPARTDATIVPRRSRVGFWTAAGACAVATVVFIIWVAFQFGGTHLTDAVDDIGELVAALVAAGACAMTARRQTATRSTWTLLALSSLAWAAGEAAWTYYDLVRGIQVPFPSWADAGFLAAVPLAGWALSRWPKPQLPKSVSTRRRHDAVTLRNTLILGCGALAMAVVLSGAASALRLAYPTGDLILTAFVLLAIRRAGRNAAGLALVLTGIVAFTLADTAFAYLTATNSYGLGNVMDAGWVLGYLLIALGALWSHGETQSTAGDFSVAADFSSATRSDPDPPPPDTEVRHILVLSHFAAMRHSRFTESSVGKAVYGASLLLIIGDAAIVLYDLALALKGLV
jgi:hypothetical protein